MALEINNIEFDSIQELSGEDLKNINVVGGMSSLGEKMLIDTNEYFVRLGLKYRIKFVDGRYVLFNI